MIFPPIFCGLSFFSATSGKLSQVPPSSTKVPGGEPVVVCDLAHFWGESRICRVSSRCPGAKNTPGLSELHCSEIVLAKGGGDYGRCSAERNRPWRPWEQMRFWDRNIMVNHIVFPYVASFGVYLDTFMFDPKKYRRSATKRGFLSFWCVCVNHLKRCKTSNLLVFYSIFAGGTIHVLCAMVRRSGHSTCGYHGWSQWRTCFKFHVKFLWWAVANPRTTMPFSNNLFSLCHLLNGFRNPSSWERYHFVEREGSASNSLHWALAMAMATFTVFQVLSVTYSCQV